ncbi:right-handed parallel beta-helix repeat-containing protein [Oceanirhabdus seepicola]|uniref:Right-handed parallel beta-helix repeat-containing protein n=1 Tax=Oceanirhabdus seepicola TaxID=2828781 RepID=A0A9J6PAT0_9CLOT|nr:right-handed parallel beta-helix repeat-containing protein [Oceanirhabdus seepicola]MCM1992280.1 right-handed parallel beta-helix repeat-containing protein [Oceanirhabdus seepicola]
MSIIRVPLDVPTINDAVFLSEAGDTIIVCPGVYRESVTIPDNKPKLRIKGTPKSKPILEGVCFDGGESGFNVEANGVYISNFIIKGGYTNGIEISGKDCTIDDCEIRNCLFGILVTEESEGGNLFNCVKCCGNKGDGITINGDNSCIIECTCEKNGNYGLIISGGNTLVLNCNMSFNLNTGIQIEKDTGRCLFNLIIGCTIKCNLNDGIRSRLGRTFILNNCVARNRSDGIDIKDTDLNSVVKNKIEYNCRDGVDIDDGMLNKVIFNKVICNVGNGVAIGDDGTENFVDDNVFITNNKAGVLLLKDSVDNAVRDNFFECNDPNISAYPPADENNVFDGNVKVNNCC